VLQGISFNVEEGQTAVIFGLNGAGKTTTVNCLAGVLPTWSGEVRFDGKKISGKDAPGIVTAGISLSPRAAASGRAVGAEEPRARRLDRKDQKAIGPTDQEVFGYFPRLDERKDQLAGTLSGGEQQMLAIGRAIMSKPRMLMIDEASLGLSPEAGADGVQVVSQINDDGPRSSSWSRTSACCPTPTRP
jgi:branched-chain amino acid transport system ATP-binding protein